MEPLERVAVFLTLIERLNGLLDEEQALLGHLDLANIEALYNEKSLLADAYAIETQRLRRQTDDLRTLDAEQRETIVAALGRFEQGLLENLRTLLHAERQLSHLTEQVRDSLSLTLNASIEEDNALAQQISASTSDSTQDTPQADNVVAFRRRAHG